MEILLLFAESGSASLGPIIGLLAVLIIIGILSKTALAGGSGGSRRKSKADSAIGNYTYYRHDIMSGAERAFFEKLYAAVRNQYWVFTKVSLWEIARNREQGGWNKIAQKHADFVLCDPRQKGKVVLVVELDDRSHNSASAQKRDAKRRFVLASAGFLCSESKGSGTWTLPRARSSRSSRRRAAVQLPARVAARRVFGHDQLVVDRLLELGDVRDNADEPRPTGDLLEDFDRLEPRPVV